VEVAQDKAPGQRPSSGEQLKLGQDGHVTCPRPKLPASQPLLNAFLPPSQQGAQLAVASSGHPPHAGYPSPNSRKTPTQTVQHFMVRNAVRSPQDANREGSTTWNWDCESPYEHKQRARHVAPHHRFPNKLPERLRIRANGFRHPRLKGDLADHASDMPTLAFRLPRLPPAGPLARTPAGSLARTSGPEGAATFLMTWNP
jgi:hypothetical protein